MVRQPAMLSVALLAACGRIAFDDAAGTDAMPGDVAAGDAPDLCVRDAFATLDVATWTEIAVGSPTSVEIDNGQVLITVVPNVSNNTYNGLRMLAPRDLSDMSITIDKLEHVNVTSTSGPETGFEIRVDADNLYLYNVGRSGTLARIRANAVDTETVAATDPNVKHVRVTHSTAAATATFLTSTDGVMWTVVASGPSPFAPTSAIIRLYAGTYMSHPDPGSTRFDNLSICPQ